MFREISCEDFDRLLAGAPASAAFDAVLARYEDYLAAFDRRYLDAAVQEGDLHLAQDLKAPAFFTLVLGDLSVDGILDLRGAYDRGGVLTVIGSVRCTHFISDIDAQVFIDGDLDATEAVIAGFEDSSLNIVGTLRARLFIGNDIGANVGDGAFVDFGDGYCTGLEGIGPVIRPRHGRLETVAALVPVAQNEGYAFDADDIGNWIRAGKPLFK